MTVEIHAIPLGHSTSEIELQALINATPGISFLIAGCLKITGLLGGKCGQNNASV